ncbi:hypothetical protein [Halomonas stenophila]|uniref:ABC-type transporter Mla subunit MlaD n=1 Tax=Halomonas stenophila TaxID=795312 RepID=A0A7W5EVT4_9GAMM|nr:hypothetical protein [Halomonas stenophila]MBB3231952.1 ABC-type transporter Mla subunit MlaD [Halomonas stenophila]
MSAGGDKQYFQVLGKDSFDKFLLALAFILGILGNILLKIFSAPIFLPAIFSAVVIIGYAVWVYNSKAGRVEPDQVGDNAYYLGFTLTLCSLAYTLFELGYHDIESEFIAHVISGFGVALSSTIVGVATRVLMLQFRLDLTARDKEARLSINQAMRLFQTELTESVRGLNYFGAEIRQNLEEHLKQTSEAHERRLDNSLENLMSGFKESISEFVEMAQASNQQLAKQATETAQSSEKKMGAVLDRLESSINTAHDNTSDGSKAISETVAHLLKENSKSLEEMKRFTDMSHKSISESIDRFSTEISSIVNSYQESLSSASSSTEAAASSFIHSSDNLGKAVAEFENRISDLSDRVSENSRNINKSLDQRLKDESVNIDNMNNVVATLREIAKDINSHKETSYSDAESLSTLLEKSHENQLFSAQRLSDIVASLEKSVMSLNEKVQFSSDAEKKIESQLSLSERSGGKDETDKPQSGLWKNIFNRTSEEKN